MEKKRRNGWIPPAAACREEPVARPLPFPRFVNWHTLERWQRALRELWACDFPPAQLPSVSFARKSPSSCGNFFVRATPTSALMLNLPLIHFFHACNYCRCAHAQSPSDLLVRHLPQAARGINFAKSCLGDDDWSWRV